MSHSKLKTGLFALLMWAGTSIAGPVVDDLYKSEITGVCVAFVQAYANGIFFVYQGHNSIEDTYIPENLIDPTDLAVYRDIASGGMITGIIHKSNNGEISREYAARVYDDLVEGCIAARGHFGFIEELPNLSQKSKDLYKDIYNYVDPGKVNN